MRNVSGSMRDTLRGVALVGMGLLTVPALVRVPSAVEACGASGAAETARGHVFEDTNGNGVRDAGEPGLAGVPVSNGCEVTLTDDGGAYAVGGAQDPPRGRDHQKVSSFNVNVASSSALVSLPTTRRAA